MAPSPPSLMDQSLVGADVWEVLIGATTTVAHTARHWIRKSSSFSVAIRKRIGPFFIKLWPPLSWYEITTCHPQFGCRRFGLRRTFLLPVFIVTRRFSVGLPELPLAFRVFVCLVASSLMTNDGDNVLFFFSFLAAWTPALLLCRVRRASLSLRWRRHPLENQFEDAATGMAKSSL